MSETREWFFGLLVSTSHVFLLGAIFMLISFYLASMPLMLG
jgi:hypothetical protein